MYKNAVYRRHTHTGPVRRAYIGPNRSSMDDRYLSERHHHVYIIINALNETENICETGFTFLFIN